MYLMAPTVALAILVVALLMVLMRLVHGRRERKRDYGLLREVATASSQRSAGLVVDRLGAHGIHATSAPQWQRDAYGIMVFPEDQQRAERVLLDETWAD
jgi:hypothetical protein